MIWRGVGLSNASQSFLREPFLRDAPVPALEAIEYKFCYTYYIVSISVMKKLMDL